MASRARSRAAAAGQQKPRRSSCRAGHRSATAPRCVARGPPLPLRRSFERRRRRTASPLCQREKKHRQKRAPRAAVASVREQREEMRGAEKKPKARQALWPGALSRKARKKNLDLIRFSLSLSLRLLPRPSLASSLCFRRPRYHQNEKVRGGWERNRKDSREEKRN